MRAVARSTMMHWSACGRGGNALTMTMMAAATRSVASRHVNFGQRVRCLSINSILEELELDPKRPNAGVYNGKWGGKGQIVDSINPATGKVIAKTQMVIFSSLLKLSLIFSSFYS